MKKLLLEPQEYPSCLPQSCHWHGMTLLVLLLPRTRPDCIKKPPPYADSLDYPLDRQQLFMAGMRCLLLPLPPLLLLKIFKLFVIKHVTFPTKLIPPQNEDSLLSYHVLPAQPLSHEGTMGVTLHIACVSAKQITTFLTDSMQAHCVH